MRPVAYSITPPDEFISIDSARLQVVVDPGDDDRLLERFTRAAVETVERDSGWMLGSRTVVIDILDPLATIDCDNILRLPLEVRPITAISTVTYRNAAGASVAYTGYQFQPRATPAFILPPAGESWPDIAIGSIDSLRITCTAGLACDPLDRRSEIATQAALLLVGHWYANRESVVIGSISKSIEQSYEALIELLRTYRYGG
jgi:uncharacterized phiE125 gp8 family phage protein